MCGCGCFGPGHYSRGGFWRRDIAFGPPPFRHRPQADEEIHYMEEYKKDLEQELNDVNERLRTMKNQE